MNKDTEMKEEELSEPLLAPLFSDVRECYKLTQTSDSQFARRAFVRASFAYFEGYLSWIQGKVAIWLIARASRNGNLEVNKFVLLSDEFYEPDKNGKLESRPNRLPFLNRCAFILRTGAECTKCDS